MRTLIRNLVTRIGLAALFISPAMPSMAESHWLIYSNKSSTEKNFFVSQGIEGEYGGYRLIQSGQEANDVNSQIWRGYGLRNSVGVEVMKFIQFSVSHTFLNMRAKADSRDNLSGSRLTGEGRFVFASPIGNLELGGGMIGARYDYRDLTSSSDFLGSGYYYSLGVDYFLSSRLSFYIHGKSFRENMVRSGGGSGIENIKSETNALSSGFNIWL